MKLRLEDVIDEAVLVSEKSTNVLLVTLLACTLLSLILSETKYLLLSPIIASSYFVVELSWRLYKLHGESGELKGGLFAVAPYITLLTASLSLFGVLTFIAYILSIFGLSAILGLRAIASKREVIVIM
ncbi:hypothetical protein [Infirmifilum sp. NZ]|uniref:hypothetical protein n=1 Tax=Infirmifilum sp. NZ TaxID=2926850 RepID=UPI000CBA3978|nr:hypothetical protein [Infirmifilum sp. NZ]PLJ77839.1 MAG: hypothetical protein B7L53_04055 [Thermofilum sp. NZ13]UNQ74069.1 hypothetical protein MOV14_03385 [Infirmifilum sp. NZ]